MGTKPTKKKPTKREPTKRPRQQDIPGTDADRIKEIDSAIEKVAVASVSP